MEQRTGFLVVAVAVAAAAAVDGRRHQEVRNSKDACFVFSW
jgi:hypothetical protein